MVQAQDAVRLQIALQVWHLKYREFNAIAKQGC
jgi:hypothetical protein